MEQLTDEDRYKKVGLEIGTLVTKKNKSYGDSFAKCGKILKILYPNGFRVEDYGNVLAIVRILDKMFRIATDADFESEQPWGDICGYALLKVTERELRKVVIDKGNQ